MTRRSEGAGRGAGGARLDPSPAPRPGSAAGSTPGSGTSVQPAIELGWVILGRLDAPDREAVERARERMLETLSRSFPDFAWRMPLVEREAPVTRTREQPVTLLDQAVVERQAKGWDFALVVTGADLTSFYKPFALGVPARSLSVAVASTIRIDPAASGRGGAAGDRAEVMAQRLYALAMHLFGHLNGLDHRAEPDQIMYDVDSVDDLDTMERLSDVCTRKLAEELADVADLRIEEMGGTPPRNRLLFYLRTAWHNADDIWGAVRQARPWQFPFRLSRLTTAAFSALLILMITAESWDLGMTQPPSFVAALSALILVVTSGYVLRRQQLLLHREGSRLTELAATSNISMVITVFLGMVTTYLGVFAVVLGLAATLFSRLLVAEWAASLEGQVALGHYVTYAAFVACLGLAIGALGATFEEQGYFRHVAYADEET